MRILKIINAIHDRALKICSKLATKIKFAANGVKYSSFRTNGVPKVFVGKNATFLIGKNFGMNNGINGNPIGCYEKCTFYVYSGCSLIIGDNVGLSQCALISYNKVIIGDNVKIGGGSLIFTTDFHSIDPTTRASIEDLKHRKCAPVIIEDNAFIGARSLILKGVTIGKNSIVAAGSVVTKSVPDNEIWGGNPAKFIRKII